MICLFFLRRSENPIDFSGDKTNKYQTFIDFARSLFLTETDLDQYGRDETRQNRLRIGSSFGMFTWRYQHTC